MDGESGGMSMFVGEIFHVAVEQRRQSTGFDLSLYTLLLRLFGCRSPDIVFIDVLIAHLIQNSLHPFDQTFTLRRLGIATTSPTDAAVVVDEVGVSHFAVKHANRFPDIFCDSLAHQKVLPPIPLTNAPSQRPREEPDEH